MRVDRLPRRRAGRPVLVAALLLLTVPPGCSGAAGQVDGADSGGADGAGSTTVDGGCADPAGADCTGRCGEWRDACGALVTCGACSGGQTCGGGGGPNLCGAGLCIPGCAGKACGASNGCDAPCTQGCGVAEGGAGDAGHAEAGPGEAGPGEAGPGEAGPKDAGPVDATNPTCSPYGTYGCSGKGSSACCAGLGCDPYLDVCYVAAGGSCAGTQSHCVGVENVACLPSGVCGATTTCGNAGADCSTAACCTNHPCTPFSNGTFTCETAGSCVPAGASCQIAPCCPGAGACTKTAAGAYCMP